jgi:hypothetical protein
MFNTIFGKVTGALGKEYLFSGLLPAGTVLLGFHWYNYGIDNLFYFLSSFSIKTDKDGQFLFAFLSWLGLGLLLFSSRSLTFTVIENLPGTFLSFLRESLIWYQLRQRQKVDREMQELGYTYTAILWYRNNFSKPKYIPKWVIPIKLNEVTSSGQEARAIIESLIQEIENLSLAPSHKQLIIIVRGLRYLYEYAASMPDMSSINEEINLWNKTLSKNGAPRVMDEVAMHVHRKWIAVRQQFHSYPNELWIKPTSIGNKSAALDEYADQRYKIDTATLFTRLWWILSVDERKSVSDSKLIVETLITLSTVTGFASVIFFIIFIMIGVRATVDEYIIYNWRALNFCLGFFAISAFTYKMAEYSIIYLYEKVTSLIDVYRLALLKKIGYIPKTIAEEIECLSELRVFFTQGIQRDRNRSVHITDDHSK